MGGFTTSGLSRCVRSYLNFLAFIMLFCEPQKSRNTGSVLSSSVLKDHVLVFVRSFIPFTTKWVHVTLLTSFLPGRHWNELLELWWQVRCLGQKTSKHCKMTPRVMKVRSVCSDALAPKKTTKRNKNIVLRTYKVDWTLLSYITQKGQIFKK